MATASSPAPAKADAEYLVTLANCNAAASHRRRLLIPGGRGALQVVVDATELRPVGIDPVTSGRVGDIGRFERGHPRIVVACQERHLPAEPTWSHNLTAPVSCAAGVQLVLELAPFSLVQLRVRLAPALDGA